VDDEGEDDGEDSDQDSGDEDEEVSCVCILSPRIYIKGINKDGGGLTAMLLGDNVRI
jgi:hypothetical protein